MGNLARSLLPAAQLLPKLLPQASPLQTQAELLGSVKIDPVHTCAADIDLGACSSSLGLTTCDVQAQVQQAEARDRDHSSKPRLKQPAADSARAGADSADRERKLHDDLAASQAALHAAQNNVEHLNDKLSSAHASAQVGRVMHLLNGNADSLRCHSQQSETGRLQFAAQPGQAEDRNRNQETYCLSLSIL